MITYSKNYWGIHLLFRLYGSSVPRALIWATLSTALTALLRGVALDWLRSVWDTPWPMSAFITLVGFAVVFRTNFGYSRYWEGRTHVAQMAARWADFATKAVTFDRVGNTSGAVPEDHADFVERLTHLLSLLHALALQHLRGDWHLSNLVTHDPSIGPPPVDAAGIPGRQHMSFLSYVMLRGSPKTTELYNSLTPLGVVGEIIEEERNGLGSRLEKLQAVTTDTLMTGNEWMGMKTRDRFMQLSTERVQVVYAWIHDLINWRLRTGGMWLPAPITTQLFNPLSSGFQSFEDARKLVDTPFPFPWSQLLMLQLLLFAIVMPFILSTFVDTWSLSLVFTFVTVLVYFSMLEVARDLEDPFVFAPNDTPLARMQYQFNERLLSMLMSPANRFHMPPPSMKAMPSDPADPMCGVEATMMDELDEFCTANAMRGPDEQADCTTADHHAVPVGDAAHEGSDRMSDVPQGLLLRPQPRRSHDVDMDDGGGLRRRVTWSDPVPLWSVDHLTGMAPVGPMSPRARRESLERALPSSGRASLDMEYNTERQWELPVQACTSPSALNRSSV